MGLTETEYKASPPAQWMVLLGLHFDTVVMSITIPEVKKAEVLHLVQEWQNASSATIHLISSLLGKLFFMEQCWPPPPPHTHTRFSLNCMLETLRAYPVAGAAQLSPGFRKDLN